MCMWKKTSCGRKLWKHLKLQENVAHLWHSFTFYLKYSVFHKWCIILYLNNENSVDNCIRRTAEARVPQLLFPCNVCKLPGVFVPSALMCTCSSTWDTQVSHNALHLASDSSSDGRRCVLDRIHMQFQSWELLSINIFIFLLMCNFPPPWCGLLSSPQISVFFGPPVSRSHAHHLKAAGSAVTPQTLSLPCLPWQITLQIVKWRRWPVFRHLLRCNDSRAFAAREEQMLIDINIIKY